MTPDQFTRRLPPLSHNPLPAKPPFVFNGLSSRVLPLRANLDALQRFVNSYLNFVPESVGRFRASVPYVFLSVLDYGSVSESAGLGWFAQTEVFFAVPLEWYCKIDGRWVFQRWATITPFIYVDDNFSVPLGRTVSGFPKVLSRVTQVSSEWVRNPLAALTLARIETPVFPAAYAGKRLENRVFLEVMRDAPMSNARLPPDMRSPALPWTVAANLADAAGGLGRDALWLAQALRIFPQVPAGQMAGMLPEMLAGLAPALAPGGPGLVMNSLNLKQFRRTDRPDELCYQALTNGPMITSAVNQGGLLGEERTLLGDLSGGHSIRLHEYPALPIAKTLGLEVQRRWQGDGVVVAELKPVMPFWMDVNVSLEPSQNLAWRGQDGVWKDGSGAPLPADARPEAAGVASTKSPTAPPTASATTSPTPSPAAEPAPAPRFNTALASAVESIAGPFEFSDSTLRVLPLLARRDKLQAFLDTTLNHALADPVLRADGQAEQVRLRVWCRPPAQVNSGAPIGGDHAYVYLVATRFGDVTSASNNVGDWAKDELAFLVPVAWERQDGAGRWQTTGVGLVPAFFFVDDSIAAISRYEVQGIDARTADFHRPETDWLGGGASGHGARQTVLRMDAEVWAALDAGQQAMVQPVVEIVRQEANAGLGHAATQDAAFHWSELLRLELGTKKGTQIKYPKQTQVARALALELLGNQTPLALYSLKQFRDGVDPDRACYQALVRVPRRLKEVFDLCEIEETLTVRLHDYPKLAIVASLGLVATQLENSGAGITYSAQAVRPFYIRATLTEALPEQLMSRTGSRLWQLSPQAFDGRLNPAKGGPAIQATLTAETLQDRADPCRMVALMFHARSSAQPITAQQARQALALIDPQMVVEAVLSREWGNAHSHARWRAGRQALAARRDALPRNGDPRGEIEAALYRDALQQLMARQGFPNRLGDFAGQVIAGQKAFTAALAALEHAFDGVAPWLLWGLPERPDSRPFTPDDAQALGKTVPDLMQALHAIGQLRVVGEPSANNNLDMQVLGYRIKLDEMLSHPPLQGLAQALSPPTLTQVLLAAEALREAVVLARRYAGAQTQAMLNALSRAWQKPDYCIRRDAVGDAQDRLLTATGSWDADWYYGKRIEDIRPQSGLPAG